MGSGQKEGSRDDGSQTGNQAWPSAKLLPGPKLGQDVSARKLGFLAIKQRWGEFRDQAGGCLEVDQEM